MRQLAKPLLSVLFTAAVLTGCGKKAEAPAAPPAPQVSVATPISQNVVDWDEFVGRFEPTQQVDVRARAGGYLQAVHFRDGQAVKAGQLLFTLDPRPAQAQLAAAQAQAGLARGDLQRAEALVAAQAISREEYESRKAAVLVADAAVRARQLDVEFTRVVAPVSGIISDRRVDPGNVISGGSSAADVLTTIVSTNPIHFTFEASEAQLLKYQRESLGKGGRVEIRLQDEDDYRWRGVIDFSDNAVDDGSGAVRMRAVVQNPNGFLKPGMFGRARVEGSNAYDALLIPETAVVADGVRKVAYVVGADGTVAVKPLTVGPVVNGLRVVQSGLAPSDRVVVNGLMRVKPGAKVQAKLTQISATAPQPHAPTTVAAPARAASVAGR
jgi:RND family efflux transporter MFP subunit